ncbi:hypothetical protein HELRODRAFT_178953 [Helobdella robusta]|uniref:WSC domain-containing protein n=1 Tax=Helobdella robusta TaxID=6412 RepID=T1FDY3_HELRO|nr:hypothetical protein HELRODRAFT_178953 [Helobdella robusta]ESN95772.1 hypothetical protein HELRODRAFT_178953 [Helobdella robusta]
MPGTAVTVIGFKLKIFFAYHMQCVYIVDPRIMQLKLLRNAKMMVVRKNYYEEATETYIGCYREVLAVNAGIVDSYEGCKMLCRNEVTPYIALHEGNECYCVARAKYAVNSKFCNLKCKSGEDGCGGDKYYSLFSKNREARTDVPMPPSNEKLPLYFKNNKINK